MSILKRLPKPLTLIILMMMMLSCEDMLNVDLKDVVTSDKNFKNDFDSRAAALGIAGLFQETLADQYILLGELRADLLDVTLNADEYMRQLSVHSVDPSNPYLNPGNFYKIILSCNDALSNINIMNQEGRISLTNYSRDYSEIAAFRCWMYYLLAVHFGSVPYVTETIEDIDMTDINSYPVVSLDNMIDSLAAFMSSLPSLGMTDWGISIDDYGGINRAFVDKTMFLADLFLWKGYYREAAVLYRTIMDEGNDLASLDKYKCSYYFGYNYPAGGGFSWPNMFKTYIGGISSSAQYREWRWFCIVDNRFDQTNSLVKWFSGNYGQYMLKPSYLSISNWKEQHLINGKPGDLRGEGASWADENGNPVVQKYLFGVTSQFNQDADLFIFRGGTVFLRYAEAANRLGYCRLALAILNSNGLAADSRARELDDYVFRFDSTATARLWTRENQYKYRDSYGVRGRCYVAPPEIPELSSKQDSIIYIENIISQEYALELAYEGDRWQNLMRIANRREKEAAGTGVQFLADAVARKFEVNGDNGTAALVRTRLLIKDNWFLPFNQ